MIFFPSAPIITLPVVSQWKDLFPLVSPVVVILLFIIDRIIGFWLRKKEVERNWYLKVLIEPDISKISMFYKNTLDCYNLSSEFLKQNNHQSHTEFIKLKSIEFGKFQVLKRELETEVIYPIQIRYPAVGEKITEQIRNLEDSFTLSLDSDKFSEEDIISFHLIVANNRAKLLNELYLPLK